MDVTTVSPKCFRQNWVLFALGQSHALYLISGFIAINCVIPNDTQDAVQCLFFLNVVLLKYKWKCMDIVTHQTDLE